MPNTGYIRPFLLGTLNPDTATYAWVPFVSEHPCNAGSTWIGQAAYDIVRPLTNSQMREFISPTSSLTLDAYNFTASVDAKDDHNPIILDLTYKMPTA